MPLTQFFTDPNVIFMLMTLGCYGLVFEFVSPGIFVPGIAGALLLLFGFFTLDQMPVSYVGVFLMMSGIGIMTAEAFFKSRFMLALVGAAAYAAGGVLFLNNTVSLWLIASMTLISTGLLSVGLKIILRTRQRDISTGAESLRHATGEIVEWSGSKGEVAASGTVWRARSLQDYTLNKGDKVKVTDIDGLCLIIQPHH